MGLLGLSGTGSSSSSADTAAMEPAGWTGARRIAGDWDDGVLSLAIEDGVDVVDLKDCPPCVGSMEPETSRLGVVAVELVAAATLGSGSRERAFAVGMGGRGMLGGGASSGGESGTERVGPTSRGKGDSRAIVLSQ